MKSASPCVTESPIATLTAVTVPEAVALSPVVDAATILPEPDTVTDTLPFVTVEVVYWVVVFAFAVRMRGTTMMATIAITTTAPAATEAAMIRRFFFLRR